MLDIDLYQDKVIGVPLRSERRTRGRKNVLYRFLVTRPIFSLSNINCGAIQNKTNLVSAYDFFNSR